MVVPEMSATMPWVLASATRSGTWNRESGTSSRAGSSQARPLMAMWTSGGKDRRSPAAWSLLEAGEALLEEPLPPFGHDLPAGVEAGGDLVVVEPVGGHQDDLGSDDVSIRQRIRRALASSSARCWSVRVSTYGLFLGIGTPLVGGDRTLPEAQSYVTVVTCLYFCQAVLRAMSQ